MKKIGRRQTEYRQKKDRREKDREKTEKKTEKTDQPQLQIMKAIMHTSNKDILRNDENQFL